MAKLKISNDWWTAPAESDNGNLILVTGRRDLQNVIETGRYRYRVEVSWCYEGNDRLLPQYADSKIMEDLGISPSRRVKGLGARQREQLLEALAK